MQVSVYRKAQFNAAHRLYRADWSTEQNNAMFGLCSNANYHGHNYTLIVKITGEINPETGYVIDMKQLKRWIDEDVIEAFDHKNLNMDCPEFLNLNPTAEHIAVVIYNKLIKRLPSAVKLKVKLYETERNFVSYEGK